MAALPSLKDKTMLLVKLMTYDRKDDDKLTEAFLTIVRDIYLNPSLCGTELTSKLEPAFLFGLRWKNSALRREFFEIFHQSMETTLFRRLFHLMGVQQWQSFSVRY